MSVTETQCQILTTISELNEVFRTQLTRLGIDASNAKCYSALLELLEGYEGGVASPIVTANFSSAAKTGQVDGTVTVEGSATLSQIVIDWGDGSSSTLSSTPFSVTHEYTGYGEYTVTVTATDSMNRTGVQTGTITLPWNYELILSQDQVGNLLLEFDDASQIHGIGGNQAYVVTEYLNAEGTVYTDTTSDPVDVSSPISIPLFGGGTSYGKPVSAQSWFAADFAGQTPLTTKSNIVSLLPPDPMDTYNVWIEFDSDYSDTRRVVVTFNYEKIQPYLLSGNRVQFRSLRTFTDGTSSNESYTSTMVLPTSGTMKHNMPSSSKPVLSQRVQIFAVNASGSRVDIQTQVPGGSTSNTLYLPGQAPASTVDIQPRTGAAPLTVATSGMKFNTMQVRIDWADGSLTEGPFTAITGSNSKSHQYQDGQYYPVVKLYRSDTPGIVPYAWEDIGFFIETEGTHGRPNITSFSGVDSGNSRVDVTWSCDDATELQIAWGDGTYDYAISPLATTAYHVYDGMGNVTYHITLTARNSHGQTMEDIYVLVTRE